MTTRSRPPDDLTASAKLVWVILHEIDEATAREIADASFVPRRTVNRALRELRDRGYVTKEERPKSPTYRTARQIDVTASH